MRKLSVNLVLTDWRDHIPLWVFWAVVCGIPLVWMRGLGTLFVVGPLVLLSFGLLAVGRPGQVAKTSLSFCLPGFRESLRRRYFVGAAVTGLAGALLALALNLPLSHQERWPAGGDLTDMYLQVVSGFLVGMAVALVLGTPRLILSRLAWKVLMLLSIPLFLIGVVAIPALVEYPAAGIPVCGGICLFFSLFLAATGGHG